MVCLVGCDNKMCSVDSTVGSSIEYFSLITFSDVSESYSSFSDITSHFTRALNMSPDSSDYVGIFPVGWKSVDEYVCSQPVVVPADLSSSSVCTHSVTFPGRSLFISIFILVQCFDTVGWVTRRTSGLYKVGCWFVGGVDLNGALHVLYLRLSPLTTSIALRP